MRRRKIYGEFGERFDTETEIEYLELEESKINLVNLVKIKASLRKKQEGFPRQHMVTQRYTDINETVDSYSFIDDFNQLKDEL